MKRTVNTDAGRMTYALIRTVHLQPQVMALPGGQVRVYAPAGLSLHEADALVQQQAAALRARMRRLDAPQCAEGFLPIEGVLHAVRREAGHGASFIENGVIHLVQDDLQSLLLSLAQQRIAQRLEIWHARIGGEYSSVTVEELDVKWGVCTQQRELRFNYCLILAPPEALDYVVIHELCHLHEFSHSPRFWRMVEAQMPTYEVWKKWLSAHKQELMGAIARK